MLPDDRQPSDNAWIVDNPYLIALRSELPVIQGTILKSTAAAKTEVSSARHGQETAFEERKPLSAEPHFCDADFWPGITSGLP